MNNFTNKKFLFHFILLAVLGFAAQPMSVFYFESLDYIVLTIVISVVLFSANYLVIPYLLLIFLSNGVSTNLGINIISQVQVLALIMFVLKVDKSYVNIFVRKSGYLIFLFILFFIVNLVSILRLPHSTNSDLIPFLGSYFRIFTILLFALSVYTRTKNMDKKAFLFYLLLITSSIFGMSINYFVNALNFGDINQLDYTNLRISLLFDPNYGSIVNGFMLALISLILFTIRIKNYQKILLIMLGALAVISIVYAGSRTALFAAVAGILSVYLIHLKKSYKYLLIPFLIATLIINYLPFNIFERIIDVQTGFETARKLAFLNALNIFKQNIIFGAGSQYYLSSFSIIASVGAHNTFLEYAAQGGLLLLSIFLLILLILYKRIRKMRLINPLIFNTYLILLITFIVAANGLSFGTNDFAVIFLVVLFGVITSYKYRLESINKKHTKITNNVIQYESANSKY